MVSGTANSLTADLNSPFHHHQSSSFSGAQPHKDQANGCSWKLEAAQREFCTQHTPSPALSPPPDSWELTPQMTELVLGLLLGGGWALQHRRPWEAQEWEEEESQTLPVSENKALSGM